MDTKQNILLIFIISTTCLFPTCKKGEVINESYTYNFKANWSITPERDSINVGDTLTIESTFSNYPFDYNTNLNVDFSGNALIGTSLTLRAIKGFNNAPPAIDSFSFISLIGKCETDFQFSYIKQIYWQEINNTYSVKVKIIALKKGIFFISIIDALAKNKKNSASVLLSNNNIKNNSYYLESYYGTILPEKDKKYVYCFKVR